MFVSVLKLSMLKIDSDIFVSVLIFIFVFVSVSELVLSCNNGIWVFLRVLGIRVLMIVIICSI